MKKAVFFLLAACLVLTGCGHQHSFKPATCTEPEICAECGETRGEALGHDWIAATCTAPKTCSRCGETEGLPVSHSFGDEEIVQAASCTEPGKARKVCSVCGASSEREIPASGHTATIYCETCGEPTIVLCAVGEWYDVDGISIRVDSITDSPDNYGYHHFMIRYTLRNNTQEYTESKPFGVYSVYKAESDNGFGWKLSPEETQEESMEWTVKDDELQVCFIQYPASGRGHKLNPEALHWIVKDVNE